MALACRSDAPDRGRDTAGQETFGVVPLGYVHFHANNQSRKCIRMPLQAAVKQECAVDRPRFHGATHRVSVERGGSLIGGLRLRHVGKAQERDDQRGGEFHLRLEQV